MDPQRQGDLEPRRPTDKRRKDSGGDREMKLEGKDIPAIIISALLVFGPIVLVLALIAALLIIF